MNSRKGAEKAQDKMQNKPQPGEVYRHHSGTLYEVLQPVFDANTGEQLVMYQKIRQDILGEMAFVGPRYIHTVENFMREGRFERVR